MKPFIRRGSLMLATACLLISAGAARATVNPSLPNVIASIGDPSLPQGYIEDWRNLPGPASVSYAGNAAWADIGTAKVLVSTTNPNTYVGGIAAFGDVYTIDLPNGGLGYIQADVSFSGVFSQSALPDPGVGAGYFISEANVSGAFTVSVLTPDPNHIATYSEAYYFNGYSIFESTDGVDAQGNPFRNVINDYSYTDYFMQVTDYVGNGQGLTRIPNAFGSYSVMLPFTSGIPFQFGLGVFCDIGMNNGASAACDLSHSAVFNGLGGVFDASGAAVTGYTLQAASGLDPIHGYPGGSGPLGPPQPPPGDTTPRGVPEPATWAMLLAGFAALGAALRRRRLPLAASAVPDNHATHVMIVRLTNASCDVANFWFKLPAVAQAGEVQ